MMNEYIQAALYVLSGIGIILFVAVLFLLCFKFLGIGWFLVSAFLGLVGTLYISALEHVRKERKGE